LEPRVIDAERGPRWHPSRLPARHLDRRGGLTGRGADIILIDDPLKPEQALSDARRKSAKH